MQLKLYNNIPSKNAFFKGENMGKILAIEGANEAGKTSAIQEIVKMAKGLTVHIHKEPSSECLKEIQKINENLPKNIKRVEQHIIYDKFRRIEKSVLEHSANIIIFDRCFISTIIYQMSDYWIEDGKILQNVCKYYTQDLYNKEPIFDLLVFLHREPYKKYDGWQRETKLYSVLFKKLKETGLDRTIAKETIVVSNEGEALARTILSKLDSILP